MTLITAPRQIYLRPLSRAAQALNLILTARQLDITTTERKKLKKALEVVRELKEKEGRRQSWLL